MSDYEKNPLKAIMRLKERSRSLSGEHTEHDRGEKKTKKNSEAGNPAELKNAGQQTEEKKTKKGAQGK